MPEPVQYWFCSRRCSPDCTVMVPVDRFNPKGVMCPACRAVMARIYQRRYIARHGGRPDRKPLKLRDEARPRIRGRCWKCGKIRVLVGRALCSDCFAHGEDRHDSVGTHLSREDFQRAEHRIEQMRAELCKQVHVYSREEIQAYAQSQQARCSSCR